MPENEVVTDVNAVNPAPSVPSELTNQNPPAPTPAGEQPAQTDSDPKGPVPYDRFKEVIDQKNELAAKLDLKQKEMESQLAELKSKLTPETPPLSKVISQRLTAKGVDEEVAAELANVMLEASGQVVNQRVTPLEVDARQRQTDDWVDNFAKSHPDFDKLHDKMYETMKSLPKLTQEIIASDPKGLELLYDHVKKSELESELKTMYQKGVDDAYAGKANKSSVSSSTNSGSVQTPVITQEAVDGMDLSDYMTLVKKVGGVDKLLEILATQKNGG